MSKYLKQANEIILLWQKDKHLHLGELRVSFGQEFILYHYYKIFIIFCLTQCNENQYKTLLWRNEQKLILETLAIAKDTKTTYEILSAHLKSILVNSKRGFWIFNIGFSNGFLYELLIVMLNFLKNELPKCWRNLYFQQIFVPLPATYGQHSASSMQALLITQSAINHQVDDSKTTDDDEFDEFIRQNNISTQHTQPSVDHAGKLSYLC